eukprot:1356399-Amphidinium_carterae.1
MNDSHFSTTAKSCISAYARVGFFDIVHHSLCHHRDANTAHVEKSANISQTGAVTLVLSLCSSRPHSEGVLRSDVHH